MLCEGLQWPDAIFGAGSNPWSSEMKGLIAVVAGVVLLWGSAQAEEPHLDKLKGYTETLRNMAFSVVVSSSGKECLAVTHSFIRGADGDGTVYVGVRCKNGNDYLILESGEAGGAKILTCAQADAIMQSLGLSIGCWDPL